MTIGRIWLATNYDFSEWSLSLYYENAFDERIFILGMLVYALGFAFEQAVKIQEENELTV